MSTSETSFYQHLKKLDPGTSKVYQEPHQVNGLRVKEIRYQGHAT